MTELPANWYLKYLGKPWRAVPKPPDSFNCGELVRHVHLDIFGIDTPAIPVADAQSRLQCARAMQPDIFGLLPLGPEDKPQAMDVVFMGRRTFMGHCGVGVATCEGFRILHCPEARCGVVLDSVHELRLAGFNRLKWFRHKELWHDKD